MIIKRVIIAALVITMCSLSFKSFALSKQRQQSNKELDFEKRIHNIDSTVVDLTDIYALHHLIKFNDIYNDPVEYQDSVIKYLYKPVSFEKKLIAVCMMSNLPLDAYIKMLNAYYFLYNKKIISEKLLERCIFNEFDSSNRLARQYKNPKLRVVLYKMLYNSHLSPNFKRNVKETLSGKWYEDLKSIGHI